MDLGLVSVSPPDILLHGTAERFIEAIHGVGLIRGQRHHVHMTENETVALRTGARYGKPTLLKIDAKTMAKDGYVFVRSENNVWLTDEVPPKYLKVSNHE